MIAAESRQRRLRWAVILWALAAFIWLGPEDESSVPVVLLSLTGALIPVMGWISRNSGGWINADQRAVLFLLALAGTATGAGTSLLTAVLMVFKNARHAHLVPDFPASMIGDVLALAPVWALSGALAGLGSGIIWMMLTRTTTESGGHVEQQVTRIYIVRHGETDWNVERRFQGQTDTHLNANGVAQANEIAREISRLDETFAAIYASPLMRTMQTARPIATALGMQIQTDDALKEIYCGQWEGLNPDQIEAKFPGMLQQWRSNISTFRMPDGESVTDVQKRTSKFYRAARDRHPGEAFLVVAHGASLLSMIAYMFGWDLDEIWNNGGYRLHNARLTIIHYDPATKTHSIKQYDGVEP